MIHKGYRDLGFAKVDIDREKRRGYPEVIYCPGKTKEQIRDIARIITKEKHTLLLTRVERKVFVYLKKHYPRLKYSPLAKLAYIQQSEKKTLKKSLVLVISAGTADTSVAEEAALTCEIFGSPVRRIYDAGVAGIHRLLDKNKLLEEAAVIIVVAGMEGALASIVSGMFKSPVIAVPTSVGYGASFKGVSALLTMLNSCSPGIATVNIDNGFGAGYFANLINK
ncbi:MAG: nickel pincer cofactor biosynthesis protein LarB [Candidatus Omnitrophota bacterium]